MKLPRDSQRGRVYAAEALWRPVAKANGWITTFPTKWELGEYVAKVHAWTAAKRGRVPYQRTEAPTINVRKGAKGEYGLRSFAYPYRNMIRIGRLDTHSTLHELAHIYAPITEQHGPLFCVAYLALVKQFMGEEAAAKLAECFGATRVRIKPKRHVRRKPMSAERKKQLTEQLKKARAARQLKKAADSDAGPTSLTRLFRFGAP